VKGLGSEQLIGAVLFRRKFFFFPEEIRLDKDWGSGGRVVDDDVD
jgi:hypothetical protein